MNLVLYLDRIANDGWWLPCYTRPLIKPQREIKLRWSAVACDPLFGGASTPSQGSPTTRRGTVAYDSTRPDAARVGARSVSGRFAKWLTNHLFYVTSKWPANDSTTTCFRGVRVPSPRPPPSAIAPLPHTFLTLIKEHLNLPCAEGDGRKGWGGVG